MGRAGADGGGIMELNRWKDTGQGQVVERGRSPQPKPGCPRDPRPAQLICSDLSRSRHGTLQELSGQDLVPE